jgi:hypothetical protein
LQLDLDWTFSAGGGGFVLVVLAFGEEANFNQQMAWHYVALEDADLYVRICTTT